MRELAREAEVLRRLAHPCLVRGLGAVCEGPFPHLLLEHVDGPTLHRLVRRYGPLPAEQLLRSRCTSRRSSTTNVGLALMVVLSLLPVGLLQTWAAVETGTWWARSAEFMQRPLMNALRWLRVPGDTLFAVGALVLGWFVLGLATGWSLERRGHVDEGSTEVKPGAAEAPGRA